MTILTVEDKPRKQRDAHYEKVIAQRRRLRNQQYENALGMGNLGFNLGLAQKPTTDKLDQLQKQFAAAYEKKKIEQSADVENIPSPPKDDEQFLEWLRKHGVIFEDDLETASESEGEEEIEKEGEEEIEKEGEEEIEEVIPEYDYRSYIQNEEFSEAYQIVSEGDNITDFMIGYLLKEKQRLGKGAGIDNQFGFTVNEEASNIYITKWQNKSIELKKGKANSVEIEVDDKNPAVVLTLDLFVLLRFTNPAMVLRRQVRQSELSKYIKLLRITGYRGQKPAGKSDKYDKLIEPKFSRETPEPIKEEGEEEASSSTLQKSGQGMTDNIAQANQANGAFTRGIEQGQRAEAPPAGKGKKSPGIKLDSNNMLGNIHVDIPKLRSKFKLIAHKNNKPVITEQLTKKEAEDLDALLTRRLNKKRTYSGKALSLLERIRDKSNIPTIGPNIRTEKSRIGSATYKYYDNSDLINRLKILLASKNAGNSTNEIMSELSAVLDVLMERKVISPEEYEQVIN